MVLYVIVETSSGIGKNKFTGKATRQEAKQGKAKPAKHPIHRPATMARTYLLSRTLDPLLGVFTGFLAYYLHETNHRTAPPEGHTLKDLVRWQWSDNARRREEAAAASLVTEQADLEAMRRELEGGGVVAAVAAGAAVAPAAAGAAASKTAKEKATTVKEAIKDIKKEGVEVQKQVDKAV